MSLIERLVSGPPSVDQRTSRELTRYEAARELDLGKEEIDCLTLADAQAFALSEECALLDYGMMLAQGNPVKQQLAMNKVCAQAALDDRRVMQRWGRRSR